MHPPLASLRRLLPALLAPCLAPPPAARGTGGGPAPPLADDGVAAFRGAFPRGALSHRIASDAEPGEGRLERLVPLLGAEPKRKTQARRRGRHRLGQRVGYRSGQASDFPAGRAPRQPLVLGDYDDYVYMLVAHEYVHVLHLGTVGGVPSWLNWIFGEVWVPNATQPRFVTEGLATYQESHLSSAGRMRSALFDMYLRADVLEDGLLIPGSSRVGRGAGPGEPPGISTAASWWNTWPPPAATKRSCATATNTAPTSCPGR